jgi:hypothetical protein
MDTTTVLEIIKMLDVRIANYEALEEANMDMDISYHGVICDWTEFRDHLQSFIEGQVSAIENSTREIENEEDYLDWGI